MATAADEEKAEVDWQRIARAVEALTDDFYRQGNHLTEDSIRRTLEKRKLSSEEATLARTQLAERLPTAVSPGPEVVEIGWQPTKPVRVRRDRAVRGSSSDSLKIYLREIGGHRLLTKEDEVTLARRMQDGVRAAEGTDRESRRLAAAGRAAEAKFVESNLRLVVNIAKKYAKTTGAQDFSDLIQEGNLGLLHAVEKFDHTKGFKFSTYATWWIRQAISRAIANNGATIRLPVHAFEEVTKIRRKRAAMISELGREPTTLELADQLQMDAGRLQFLLDAAAPTASLDQNLGHDDEGDLTLADVVRDRTSEDPSEVVERLLLSEEVANMLSRLSEREQEVIRLRFGLSDGQMRTLDEVGREFGVTRERIRQIEEKTLVKLRHPIRSDRLRDWIEWLPKVAAEPESDDPGDLPTDLTGEPKNLRTRAEAAGWSVKILSVTDERVPLLARSGVPLPPDGFVLQLTKLNRQLVVECTGARAQRQSVANQYGRRANDSWLYLSTSELNEWLRRSALQPVPRTEAATREQAPRPPVSPPSSQSARDQHRRRSDEHRNEENLSCGRCGGHRSANKTTLCISCFNEWSAAGGDDLDGFIGHAARERLASTKSG